MPVVDMKGRKMELRDFAQPIPLPRVTLQFRKAFGGVYRPENPAAQLWCDMIRRQYVSHKDISFAMNFVTVEIEE